VRYLEKRYEKMGALMQRSGSPNPEPDFSSRESPEKTNLTKKRTEDKDFVSRGKESGCCKEKTLISSAIKGKPEG